MRSLRKYTTHGRGVREPKTSLWIAAATCAGALAVATVDLLPQMRGLPWYVLHVIPLVWLALWSAEDDVFPLTALAVLVSLLTMLPGYVTVDGTRPIPIGDRVLVITVIWATVLSAVLRKRARRTFRWINLAGRR